jgi:anti-sigma B factor antagonist
MEQVNVIGLQNGKLTIALSGDIDLSNAELFYQEVVKAYEGQPADILFECENLNFIDSTTLGTFVKILKMLKIGGKSLSIVSLQPKIKKLFLICALDKVMEIA